MIGWDETYGATSHSYQHGSVKQIMLRPEHVGLTLQYVVRITVRTVSYVKLTYTVIF